MFILFTDSNNEEIAEGGYDSIAEVKVEAKKYGNKYQSDIYYISDDKKIKGKIAYTKETPVNYPCRECGTLDKRAEYDYCCNCSRALYATHS